MTTTDARALDARVHELLTGEAIPCIHATVSEVRGSLVRCDDCGEEFGTATLAMARNAWPRYLTDPSADYEVLRHVRRFWSADRRMKFGRALVHKIWRGRWGNGWAMPAAMHYEPGDYSLAALAVIEGE